MGIKYEVETWVRKTQGPVQHYGDASYQWRNEYAGNSAWRALRAYLKAEKNCRRVTIR